MHDLHRMRGKILTRGRIVLACGIGLSFILVVMSVYFYNLLVSYQQDVLKEGSKIDSLLQRRRNISLNLARTVRDYAIHEKGVFGHVSDVRASSQASSRRKDDKAAVAGPAGEKPRAEGVLDEMLALLEGSAAGGLIADDRLAGLLAVAERYPDLKLSENFRRFMDALIETEKDLSDARMKYAEVVNTYTTQLRTFPCRMFGYVYGFESLPYYEADTEAKSFRVVEY